MRLFKFSIFFMSFFMIFCNGVFADEDFNYDDPSEISDTDAETIQELEDLIYNLEEFYSDEDVTITATKKNAICTENEDEVEEEDQNLCKDSIEISVTKNSEEDLQQNEDDSLNQESRLRSSGTPTKKIGGGCVCKCACDETGRCRCKCYCPPIPVFPFP